MESRASATAKPLRPIHGNEAPGAARVAVPNGEGRSAIAAAVRTNRRVTSSASCTPAPPGTPQRSQPATLISTPVGVTESARHESPSGTSAGRGGGAHERADGNCSVIVSSNSVRILTTCFLRPLRN